MKKEKKTKNNTYYCEECGSKLKKELVGAEKYTDYIDEFVTIRYEKYDMKTGKRQYVWKYTCPKKRWWNNHSSFMAGVIVEK
jgi:hypothetical protein